MKSLFNRIVFVWFVAFVALFSGVAHSRPADNVTISAVAEWIVKQTKNNIQWPQAMKIASTVFDEVYEHRIDPYLVVAMISAESMFNSKAGNKSGARGLMQVMPRWHKDKIKGRNILDVRTNIEVGVQILQDCLIKAGDKMSAGIRCYTGGASKKYETTIKAAHASIKETVVAARFANEQHIVAVAAYGKPRYWHEQMERYAISERKRHEDQLLATKIYDSLVVAMNKSSQPVGVIASTH